MEALARTGAKGRIQTYTRTRHFVCQNCCLQIKTNLPPKLRLDTIQQTLICSVCSNTDVLSIDLVGRVLTHKQLSYLLCPNCLQIQQYKGSSEMRAWYKDGCQHTTGKGTLRSRPLCMACSEPANQHRIERVDHLTGEIRVFSFCQRHMPRADELARCLNARQLNDRFCPDD